MNNMRLSNLISLYVKKRPFLSEALRMGIVNHSALARRISDDLGTDSADAVKMALIRLSGKLWKKQDDLEGKILSILKKSSMTLRNKVAVVITSRPIENLSYLSYTQSGRQMTYIVEESELGPLKGKYKIEENLNLIVIQSPEEVEEVPGVISHLLSSLSNEGINVVEFISCYTDTLLVVRQADTAKTYSILSDIMG